MACSADCPIKNTADGESIDPTMVYSYGCESMLREVIAGVIEKTKVFVDNCGMKSDAQLAAFCAGHGKTICESGTVVEGPKNEVGQPNACGCRKR